MNNDAEFVISPKPLKGLSKPLINYIDTSLKAPLGVWAK